MYIWEALPPHRYLCRGLFGSRSNTFNKCINFFVASLLFIFNPAACFGSLVFFIFLMTLHKCHSLSQHYWSVLRRLGISCYLPYIQPCCLLSCGVSASSGRAKATDHEIFHFPSKTRFSSSAAKKKHHSDECAIRLIKSLLVVHRIHWRKWGQGRKEVVYMSSGQLWMWC